MKFECHVVSGKLCRLAEVVVWMIESVELEDSMDLLVDFTAKTRLIPAGCRMRRHHEQHPRTFVLQGHRSD
jgi:hypothetical protein